MTDEAVDLRAIITQLCKKTGLQKKNLWAVTVYEEHAKFEVLAVDDNGNHYIDPQTNELALDTPVVVEIKT